MWTKNRHCYQTSLFIVMIFIKTPIKILNLQQNTNKIIDSRKETARDSSPITAFTKNHSKTNVKSNTLCQIQQERLQKL